MSIPLNCALGTKAGLMPLLVLACLMSPTQARAQMPSVLTQEWDVETPATSVPSSATAAPVVKRGFSAIDRPMGMAELGLGWLTLPNAEVCVERETGCRQGDTSPQVDLWQYFRLNIHFAWGAGVTLGLIPTTDAPRQDPPGVTRSHQRGYFAIETMARYYPYVGESVEAWLGPAAGLVVLRDTYRTTARESEYARVGTPGVTIRTEGYSVGLAGGAALYLAPGWSLGLNLRLGSWFLPKDAGRSPFDSDDENALGATRASLTGRNTLFSLELAIAYRSTL